MIALALLAGCGADHGRSPDASSTIDARTIFPDAPTGCRVDKMMFSQATGCGNDGSVEFCLPDGNAALVANLATISPTISCAGGGGRAMCSARPGLLLCFYPTRFPQECEAPGGGMTDATFADMCSIAALPDVSAIVQTIFD